MGSPSYQPAGALAQYPLQLSCLDPSKIESKAEAQQIVIANIDEVRQRQFGVAQLDLPSRTDPQIFPPRHGPNTGSERGR